MAFPWRIAAWVSQTINLFILLGHHDQTVSARIHLNQYKPGWKQANKIINTLFFWEHNHTRNAHQVDVWLAKQVLRDAP